MTQIHSKPPRRFLCASWQVPLEPGPGEEMISFAGLFGNTNPVEVEIGCGKGKFLLERAAELPAVNFIALDRVVKWMRVGDERREKRNVSNLKFMKTEVRLFLRTLPEASVSIFHLYFPDPWPKRRHRKRRLISEEFLRALHARLVPGGLVEIATDERDYYAHIQKAAAGTAALWARVRESVNQRLFHETLKTNYEIKYEKAGRELFYLELMKAGG